jgi:2-isopropylmalate synthase
MWRAFISEYLPDPNARWGRFALRSVKQESTVEGDTSVQVVLDDAGQEVTLTGHGNGPIAAFCDALAGHGIAVQVLDYAEHAMSSGGDASAASYLECNVNDQVLWGVGIDSSTTTSALNAVISAVNRALR